MCEATPGNTRRSAPALVPRWGLLYAATLPQLAALGVVEAVQSPQPVRIALRCLLAFGLFGAMAVWLRANRPAFDLENWCDCAGAQMTIRVIESAPPKSQTLPIEPVFVAPTPAEEAYELTAP